MASAREIPGFAEARSFEEAAALAVRTRAEEVFAHADGVLDTDHIDRVHDMRVATRRLRAAMEIFAPCFPKKEHRGLLREVKRLADALGERRDRDVAILATRRVADAMTSVEQPGARHWIAHLRTEQATANAALARELERIESQQLESRLAALATAGVAG